MYTGLFWWIVLPVLVAAVLVYLGILTIGLGTIRAAVKSTHPLLKVALLAIGLSIVASPLLYHGAMEWLAQRRADVRQTSLTKLERTSLSGRLPGTFIAVGNLPPAILKFIETGYGLRPLSGAENKRAVDAYRAYRQAELCHRRFAGEFMPGTKLPKCKPLPDSVQSALGLREPILVFAESRHTSMREDNVIAGEIYEIRLITPEADLLVDYFEERTVEGTPSIFNPFASSKRSDPDKPAPRLRDFIETAMKGASR